MSTLDLTGVWLASSLDLSDVLQLQVREASKVRTSRARIVQYAGGRDVVRRRQGVTVVRSYTCVQVDPDDLVDLEAREGTVQLVRDSRGVRMWGLVGAVSSSEFRPRDRLDTVTFQVTSVTVTEVV